MLKGEETCCSVSVGKVEFSGSGKREVVSHYAIDFFAHWLDGDWFVISGWQLHRYEYRIWYVQGCHFNPDSAALCRIDGAIELALLSATREEGRLPSSSKNVDSRGS